MKRKKNIIDEISLLMMGPPNPAINSYIIAIIDQLPDIDLQGRDGRTLLIHACAYNKNAIAQYLIDKKADLNIQDDIGYSALHGSVSARNLDCAKLLLQAGADVNLRDAYGNIPLFHVKPTDLDMFELLLEYGANYAQKNLYDVAPIDAFQAYPAVLQIIERYKKES